MVVIDAGNKPTPRATTDERMTVKGSAFLARKFLLEKEFGDLHGSARARSMFEEVVAAVPSLPAQILATTPIPMGAYLQFQDELLRRHFKNDPRAFFRFGEASAEWSLTNGPYRRLVADRDIVSLAAQGAVFYRNYYDTGFSVTAFEGDHVSQRLQGIPAPFHHVFLEYATVGYFKRALEMVTSVPIRIERVRGFSVGDPDIHYRHVFEKPPVLR
jgi:hypothetical protein